MTLDAKRAMKILHQLGSVGLAGGYTVNLFLARRAPDVSGPGLEALRAAMDRIATLVVMPSLVAVLISGLLAIAIHRPFMEAPWVWVKAGLGILVFENTLHLQGVARSAAQLWATTGSVVDPAVYSTTVEGERGALWVMLGVSVANVVLSVWRPKLRYRVRDQKPDVTRE